MDFATLLTSFEGRTPRKGFWIGLICIIVAALVLMFVLSAILPQSIASIIGMLILLYPACALYAKRLHDRNKAITPWLWIFMGPGILYSIASALGIGFTEITMPGQTEPAMMPSGPIGYILMLATVVVGLWALVEMGFLKGTQGTNDFGPDPLQN